MKPILIAFLLAVAITGLLPVMADARICVPIYQEFDECDPANGEPASWCGEYEGILGRLRVGWHSFEEWVRDLVAE